MVMYRGKKLVFPDKPFALLFDLYPLLLTFLPLYTDLESISAMHMQNPHYTIPILNVYLQRENTAPKHFLHL